MDDCIYTLNFGATLSSRNECVTRLFLVIMFILHSELARAMLSRLADL